MYPVCEDPCCLTTVKKVEQEIEFGIISESYGTILRALQLATVIYVKMFLLAVQKDIIHYVKPFLIVGYDPNIGDRNGNTALHIACSNLNLGIVRLLLNYGANPYVINSANRSALDLLADHFSGACQAFVRNDEGHLADEDVAKYQDLQETLLKILELFEHRLIIKAENPSDRAALDLILPHANKKLVTFIARWKYDFQMADSFRPLSILHSITECGNVEVAEKLTPTLDVNSLSDLGTPLHTAAFCGQEECASLYMKNGCDVDLVNKHGKTALYTALISKATNSDKVFDLLMKYRSSVNSVVVRNKAVLNVIFRRTLRRPISELDLGKLVSLVSHLIQMKVAELPVGSIVSRILRNETVLQEFDVSTFEEQCHSEVQELKVTKFCADLRMFDLLKKHYIYTAWYINPDVIESFESSICVKFPLYRDTLNIAFRNALKRRTMLNVCEPALENIFLINRIANIPSPAIRLILNYLTDADLKCVGQL